MSAVVASLAGTSGTANAHEVANESLSGATHATANGHADAVGRPVAATPRETVAAKPGPAAAAGMAWQGADSAAPAFDAAGLAAAARQPRQTAYVVRRADGALGIALGGQALAGATPGARPLVAMLAPLYPEWLGDRAFTERHGLRFPYVVGEMARGIAGTEMVIAAGRAGLLGFFGAAGLPLAQVAQAIDTIEHALAPLAAPWGVNIIHQPAAPRHEAALVEMLLARRVGRACASAFVQVTDPLVHYVVAGLQRTPQGKPVRRLD